MTTSTEPGPSKQKKRRWLKTFLWALFVLICFYFVAGYFWAPKLIRHQLHTQLNNHLGMQAEFSELKFNPLTFNVTATDLALSDANQITWYKSHATEINFDPLNLLWGETNFSAIKLINPQLNIIIDKQGDVTLPAWPEFNSSENNAPLNLIIEHIVFDQALVDLKLGTVHEDFSLDINKLELNLDRFTLGDRDNKFKVLVSTAQNEIMALDGQYNHQKKNFQSDIKLTDIQATNLNQILPNHLQIYTSAGTFQALGKIIWRLNTKPEINFSAIAIQDLASNWQQDIFTKNLSISLKNTSVDIAAKTVAVELLSSSNASWQLNWPIELPTNQRIHATENSSINDPNKADSWQVAVTQIEIENWPIEVLDAEVNAKLPIELNSITINNFNTNNQVIDFSGQIDFKNPGSLNLSGKMALSPLSIHADLKTSQLALSAFNPWSLNMAGVKFINGNFSTTQRLNFSDGHFTTTGQLDVKAAQLINPDEVTLAQWKQLSVGAVELNSQNKTIKLDQISLDQASGALPQPSSEKQTDHELNANHSGSLKKQEGSWSLIIGKSHTASSK